MAEVDDYRPSEVTAAAVLQLPLSHTKKLFLLAQKPENKYLAKRILHGLGGERRGRGLNMMILGSQPALTLRLCCYHHPQKWNVTSSILQGAQVLDWPLSWP